jgi:hypothetical protein
MLQKQTGKAGCAGFNFLYRGVFKVQFFNRVQCNKSNFHKSCAIVCTINFKYLIVISFKFYMENKRLLPMPGDKFSTVVF